MSSAPSVDRILQEARRDACSISPHPEVERLREQRLYLLGYIGGFEARFK